jgi:putative endonuclease
MMTNNHIAVGAHGEELAARFLVDAGYQVIERNWRGTRGELDLIAWDGGEIVVVEVKTRSGSGYGHPAEAVTPSKLARLRRLAGQWLAEHSVAAPSIRIDVVAVLLYHSGAAQIEHLKGVM